MTTLKVLRHEYQMDVARVILNVSYDDMNQYVGAGSPLIIRWGSHLRFDEFVGYVHSFRPQIEEITKRTEIIAISAAYPMFNESGKTYTNVGIHNVAQEIGNDYRFQVETDPHPFIHDQILQKSDSDWELLARLAEQWGYVAPDGRHHLGLPSDEGCAGGELPVLLLRQDEPHGDGIDPLANIISFEESYSATGKDPLTETGLLGVDPISRGGGLSARHRAGGWGSLQGDRLHAICDLQSGG